MDSTLITLAVGLGAWFVPGDHELYSASHRSIGTAPVLELRGAWIPHDAAHVELTAGVARGRQANLTTLAPQLNLGWTLTWKSIRPGLALGISRHGVRGPTLGQDVDWGRHVGLNVAMPLDSTWSIRVDGRRTHLSAVAEGFTHHHTVTLSVCRSL